jgi:hypothetical protein
MICVWKFGYNAGIKTTCSTAIEKSEAKAVLIFLWLWVKTHSSTANEKLVSMQGLKPPAHLLLKNRRLKPS